MVNCYVQVLKEKGLHALQVGQRRAWAEEGDGQIHSSFLCKLQDTEAAHNFH